MFRGLFRGVVLLGVAVALVTFAAGTLATLHFVSDGSGQALDPYKVGGIWVFLGAIAGRLVYNSQTPKPEPSQQG